MEEGDGDGEEVDADVESVSYTYDWAGIRSRGTKEEKDKRKPVRNSTGISHVRCLVKGDTQNLERSTALRTPAGVQDVQYTEASIFVSP